MITARLESAETAPAERVALLQRLAILEAGFGERAAERAALGGALALHGIDGAQITGLQRLDGGDPLAQQPSSRRCSLGGLGARPAPRAPQRTRSRRDGRRQGMTRGAAASL